MVLKMEPEKRYSTWKKRARTYAIEKGRKFRKIRPTVLFKCCTYFTDHDITMNAFLQNPQLSKISNL